MSTPTEPAPSAAFNRSDTAWLLTSSAMVLLMTPGLALFYGGLARNKSAVSIMAQSMVAMGILTCQWYLWGYSLAFGSGGKVLGDLRQMFCSDTGMDFPHPLAPTVPEYLFAVYQMVRNHTVRSAERFTTRQRPSLWHPNDWLHEAGVLDFAGGIVVHVVAATSALVAYLMLGPCAGFPVSVGPPHSPTLVIIGTGLLWFGWFGFNSGSALNAGFQAVSAFVNSQLAAAFAGVTWLMLHRYYFGKASVIALCTGYVAGLATITPACGYVDTLPAMAIGIIGAVGAFFAMELRKKLRMVFLNHHWDQLGYQVGGMAFAAAWAAIGTFVILFVLDRLPWLGGIRVTSEAELLGLDLFEFDEETTQPELLVVGEQNHLASGNAQAQMLEMQTAHSLKEAHSMNGIKNAIGIVPASATRAVVTEGESHTRNNVHGTNESNTTILNGSNGHRVEQADHDDAVQPIFIPPEA